jgi:1-phosphofructokinase family hexose kinase
MIVTVTANTTIDHTVMIPVLKENHTIRATGSFYSMGGKPTDAAWILGEMGIPSLALGFAAGLVGQKAEAMLRARGVTPDFIQVGGETRINTVIIAGDMGSQTTITTSTLDVEPEHLVALREKYMAALEGASCVVLGGTLPKAVPPAFYAEYIQLANEHHVPTIFDASEPNLSAGLAARPIYVKPNDDEIQQLTGNPVKTLDDAYRAGHMILEQYGTTPIITFGSEGALAVLPERAYRIPPLNIEVVSAAGAGDAVLAGLAASIERGQSIEDGLRLGTAAAAAVCLMPGTADCRRADVERLLPQAVLIPYPFKM